MVHTGEGKGKTTAAMGLAMRGWAQGWSIGIVQFVKSGKWPMGERAALLALGRVHATTGEGGPVHWYQAGAGWTWSRPATGDRAADARTMAADGWACAEQLIARQEHRLLILDEITYPIRLGWIDGARVAATIAGRPGHQHVVITGRGAPEPLLAVADLVTEMTKERHPYDAGVRGQRGIEW
ncbi:MAG: cob(I)yrinic acid a,c-diamide adenosyltransferase [Austwickia sp.]|nr:cob(I)yrinic acid a,c-diamide adenosyltransferase [Austwickia sp.]